MIENGNERSTNTETKEKKKRKTSTMQHTELFLFNKTRKEGNPRIPSKRPKPGFKKKQSCDSIKQTFLYLHLPSQPAVESLHPTSGGGGVVDAAVAAAAVVVVEGDHNQHFLHRLPTSPSKIRLI